jgi:hypothetical protein
LTHSSSHSKPHTSMTWQEDCQRKKAAQIGLIPKEWRLAQLPPDSQLDVTDVPRTCGLLSPKELEITELDDVDELLAKLVKGEWSAFEVTVRLSSKWGIRNRDSPLSCQGSLPTANGRQLHTRL